MNELELLRLENARLRKMVSTYKAITLDMNRLHRLERIKWKIETDWADARRYPGLATRIKNANKRLAAARRLIKELTIEAL